LQQAGYATDPLYADKLTRVINGGSLRQAMA
jgi:flagellar protein FlgJ